MSAATFTPGPWMYQATASDHDYIVYPESTGRDVALVRDFNEANARLIAAAPDLYEALRLAISEGDMGPTGTAGKAARAAVAKAEGSAD